MKNLHYLFVKARTCLALIIFLQISAQSNAQFKADFSSTPQSGCAPLVVNFKDSSEGEPTSWLWDLGNGTTSILENPSVAYFEPGSYTVKLTVKNSLGVDSVTKVQYITVYSSPTINFSSSTVTGCYPLPVQFSDLSFPGSGSVNKWQWDFGDGTFSELQNPNHTYTGVGNYNVSLRATNNFGCVTNKTVLSHIKISTGVKADFSNSSFKTCNAPSIVNFKNNSSGVGALTYRWDFGDGNTSTVASPTHTYNVSGNFTVTLIVTNSAGCTDTLIKPKLITVGSVKADFTAPEPICQAAPIKFNNTSSPTPASSFWDFGDGTFSDSIHPVKVYPKEGTYSVKLVSNFGACKDSVTKSIQVVAKPVASFSSADTVSCKAPFTANFSVPTVDGNTYFWDFGDGGTSNVAAASHTYLKEGVFTVKLFVTNAAGCKDSIVKSKFVTIKKPVVSINDLPTKGCAPLSHKFSAVISSLDVIAQYRWDFGDGNYSDLATPTHIYTTPGKYTVTLTYTTSGGCTDSVKKVNAVLVGLQPKSAFVLTPVNACADKTITFTDQSTGNPNQWQWFFGDGSSSAQQNPTHQYNDTGFFSVTLISLDNGCPDTLILKNAVHINPPVANFYSAKSCENRSRITFTDQSIGANSWAWNFGDGGTSSVKSPVHDYDSSGVYTVSLTVYNNLTGCSRTKTQSVKVVIEKAEFISSVAEVCRKAPVVFTAINSNPANINTYTWNFGDGKTISGKANSVTHSYLKTSAYNVSLVIKDVNGCLDTITKPMAVKVDGPTAAFRSTIPGICLNNEVTFADSSFSDGTHPLQKWRFNWGDGSTDNFNEAPFKHTYSAPGTYTVSLTVTDSKGCTDTLNKPKEIIVSKPIAAFSADTLSCTPRAVAFKNTSSGPALTYNWNFGDGSSSKEANPTHLYKVEGTYSVSLSIVDKYGCTSEMSKTNYIKVANPQAAFIMSDSVGSCPPLVVNFTNQSANYSKVLWDFGDGTTSTLVNPSHFYSTVGTFNVVLTVSGPAGCTSQATRQIKVFGPKGSFSYTNLMGCAPLQTSFRAQTGKDVSFVWDFNDGSTLSSKDSIAKHTYTTRGSYVPKMILVDAAGCKVPVIGKDTIKIFGVTASMKHNGSVICDAGNVQFDDSSTGNDAIVSYLWDFGDGTTSTQQKPVHLYDEPGSYKSSLTVTTQRGCKDSVHSPLVLKVVKRPMISILGKTGACVPAVMSFSGNIITGGRVSSALSWNWDFDNGNVSTSQTPPAQTYPIAGDFKVTAVATDVNGCKDTAITTVNAYPLPALKTSVNDDVVCVGSTASLKANGAQAYEWSPATYLSCSNCATPVSRPDSSITYRVKGTSDKGCISRDSVALKVKHAFKLSFSKQDSLCLGKSIQLNVTGSEKYTWFPSTGLDNPTSASPVASPSTSTRYMVIGTDSKGCFKDTGYVPISVFPVPVVSAGRDVTINVGQQTEIVPEISKDVTSVMWTPQTGIVSVNNPGIIVKPTESIEYTVDVKNAGGCRARDKVSVYVLCNNANVFIPNTFSPNGDGANDIFYPRGSGVFKIKNFRIFNRWGEMVFQRANFNANDAAAGWDGTYKGSKVSPDVFVYTIEVVCDNNIPLVFKGNIALLK